MKIYPYLIINFLSVACCAAYAGHDYSIKFQNLSNSTVTITPNSHHCVHGYTNKSIIVAINHSVSITIKANNSGYFAFEEAEEEFNFQSGNLSAGWINFHILKGNNASSTNSSGNVFDGGDYGQDFVNRWTFYNDNDENTTVTFW